jgi:hypothetical protein
MDNSKGSIILKVLSPSADEGQISAYLEKRTKSIPPEKIPALLKNLPVVLSRNVVATTANRVIGQLEQLGAEAFFIPLQSSQTASKAQVSSPGSSRTGYTLSPPPAISDRLPLRFLIADRCRTQGWGRLLMKCKAEIWTTLSILGIAWVFNATTASQHLLLSFSTLPTILAAYYLGRRQAVLMACASLLLAGVLTYRNPMQFEQLNLVGLGDSSPWYPLLSWGCLLLIVAYTTGTLHEKNKNSARELRQAYQGLLLTLRQLTAQNETTDNHCFRVSIYATRIASSMGLEKQDIEDIRSAALLHNIGELPISRDILSKATHWNRQEQTSGRTRLEQEKEDQPDPLSGSLGRILPILLEYSLPFDSQKTESDTKSPIPPGAHILAVADTYDTLTSDSPHRKAMAPSKARDIIVKGSGKEFGPEVVDAFTKGYDHQEMELPGIIL